MKKTIFLLIAAAALGVSCTSEPVPTQDQNSSHTKIVGNTAREYEEGTLLVKLTSNAQKEIDTGVLSLEQILEGLSESTISPLFPESCKKNNAAARHGLNRWYTVSFDVSIPVSKAAEKMVSSEHIQYVEYNTLLEKTFSDESYEYVPSAMTKASAPSSSQPFDDPELGIQWNIINTGDKSISPTAVEGADVGVKDAWRLTAGDPRVIVAVFDQGVATRHKDLVANLWVNPGENDSVNSTDDDGNGYVDDINGYNFAENKGRPSAKYGADHGTHIAGTIAATNNNGEGVSSIAGGTGNGDGVRIMSCQIFDGNGGKASKATVAKAFHYAADHGASIAQCSYGESTENYASDEEYKEDYSVEFDALSYFLDPENCNCEALETNIAVFASGNYNKPASLFPGALKGVISVTAFGPDFLPGGYSNYGAGCDISAPGGDIIENNANAPCMILSTGYTSGGGLSYVYKYGTSMACPHVSGVVALGMSYALKLGKKFSKEDFVSRLLTSADDMDSYLTGSAMKLMVEGNKYVSVDVFPKKGKMGAGAVNAWKFLMALEGTPTVVVKAGESTTVNLADYLGETVRNLEYQCDIDDASKASLGIDAAPAVKDGTITITCTKTGAGKIRFSSSVGKEGEISGLDFFRELSIVSRSNVAENGGWL